MVKWIIIGILLLPALELAVFIAVAAAIGLGWAFTLMIATTLAGFLVLKQAGRGRLSRLRTAVSENDVGAIEANTSAFLTVLAGILLFLPGFITDLIGALLLIGPLRRWCAAKVQRTLHDTVRPGVVDLQPGEWAQMPERELEHRREKDERG
jgi:UPF0716 protein FxsA